jgi:flagellar motor switch protein FliG
MIEDLTGLQKAAFLMIALGSEASANVLKQLRDREIEQLATEILGTDQIPDDARRAVLQECYQLGLGRRFLSSGGYDYAHEMLAQALGDQRSQEIISRLSETQRPQPLSFLRLIDPFQLVSFLQEEHPQTIALILAHLSPARAFEVLHRLPAEIQPEVAMRVATMEQTPTEVLEAVETVLRGRLSSISVGRHSSAGGVEHLAAILNKADRATERAVLEHLDSNSPELAETVRKLIFVFEDIAKLDDPSIQRLLREVDHKELALGLRTASDQLRERMFQNLSSRAADSLREDMEVSQPVRQRQIEEAQQNIVAAARRLDEAGEIVIQRGAENALI